MAELITVPSFHRATDYVGLWAIEAAAGAALQATARTMDWPAHFAAFGERAPRPAAAMELRAAGNEKNIAIVRLSGTLMKAQSSMGGTSTVQARSDLRKAEADPDIIGVLLLIDSPGGTVSGTEELATQVKRTAKAKPVFAQVEDLCASAAYWIASQTDGIYANVDTAWIGSIGTLLAMYDKSKAAATAGVEAVVFATGPLKGAGFEGSAITEEQRSNFQSLTDDSQKSFDAAVQKGRSLTDKQLAAVRTGGVFTAQDAISKKLIDGVQSVDVTVQMLIKESRTRSAGRSAADSAPIRGDSMSAKTTAEDVVQLVPDFTESRKAHAAEFKRIAGIQAIAAKHPAIVAEAIEGGWPVEKAELAAMKADLPKHVAANPHGPNFVFGKAPEGMTHETVIEAALAKAIGSPQVEKHYKADALQAAEDRYGQSGLGLQQLLITVASANGYHARPGERVNAGNLKGLLRAAFAESDSPQRMASGFSTVSLSSGILGNVANKELRMGYTEEDQSWRFMSAKKPVNNFQTHTSYRLLDSMEYEKVGPAGEIKHGTAGSENYTRKADTYAKMFALTRRDWINDDMGAFADLRTRLGRGAAKKFNNLFWTTFMAALATTFTAGRGNYLTGATSNLATDGVGLALGIAKFRQMKSPTDDGAKRIGGEPKYLFVPPELEGPANVLYRNQNLGATKSADANIYANKYIPITVPWLSDSAFPGYSSTAWYLLRDPGDMPAMVASFLFGNETPTVESADADFNTLGVQFRGYHDFGTDVAEYLAGVMSKGAA